MPLFFSRAEFKKRQRRTIKELAKRNLDGLLIFKQESMYYLTGYDTFGYCFFNCLYLGLDGTLTLITRLPEVSVAQQTSVIEDFRLWPNLPDVNQALVVREYLEEQNCRGNRLGIELDAYGLTAEHYTRVQAALTDFCNLENTSDLVTKLRLVKSPAELKYVRRAGELADAALVEANRLSVPGAFEGDILAAMQGVVFAGDGDYPGNPFIIGAGERALVGRYTSGRQRLGENDQLTVEWAGVYRHYHAAMFRTILTGKPAKRHIDMHKTTIETLRACVDALRPGNTVGDVYEAYARGLTKDGYGKYVLGATGYCMGVTYAPSWMDWPMIHRDNSVVLGPGMVFFIHIVLWDIDRRLSMSPGQSYIVTETGNEALSKMPLDLVVN